jgi:hypothetical protein
VDGFSGRNVLHQLRNIALGQSRSSVNNALAQATRMDELALFCLLLVHLRGRTG